LGASEDARQLVSGEGVVSVAWTYQPNPDGSGFQQVWSNPGTTTGCGVDFWSEAPGTQVRPSAATADACKYTGGASVSATRRPLAP
jgi:hypothetical protein